MRLQLATKLLILLLAFDQYQQTQDHAFPALYGVGLFQNAAQSGVPWLSMAGGGNIMIYGVKFNVVPVNNMVQMISKDLGKTLDGPPLNLNNVPRSSTGDGRLQYSVPSLYDLLSISKSQGTALESLAFDIQVSSNDGSGILSSLNCLSSTTCRITYQRKYTPVLYEMNPPVSYYGALISYIIDPRNAQDIKDPTRWPFFQGQLGDYMVNFDGYIDETSWLTPYAKNQVLGVVGDMVPSLSYDPKILFEVGYTQIQDVTSTTCSYDGTRCYQMQVLASITSVSASTGSTNGGQVLIIKGYGFVSDNIQVKTDGVACAITSITNNEVTCTTGASSVSTTGTAVPGQNGLNTRIYNGTSAYNLATMQTLPYYTTLSMRSESLQNQFGDTQFGRLMTGFFKAPATTNYKFQASCDDACEVYLSSSMSSASKTKIAYSTSYTSFRDYKTSSVNSDWIALVAGQYYYLEVSQWNSGGGDFISVAVEIEKASGTHNNNVKEVQRLQINPTNIREQSVVTIVNPDSGNFNAYIYNTTTQKYGPYTVPASATASQMKSALNSYFTTYFGASISVTLVMQDASGNVVTSMSESVQNTYTISFNKATDVKTHLKITFSPDTTSATGTNTIPPVSGIQSSQTLSGKFSITCINLDYSVNTTEDIAYDASTNTIQSAITRACSSYRDKFEVSNGKTYNYNVDGREIFLTFTQVNADVPQFTIQNGVATPLSGNAITYVSDTNTSYSSNIFYAPIPYELLYTDHTTPQISMTVDGLPVVCSNIECPYAYVATSESITSFSYGAPTLTIQGTNLPTSLTSVQFGLKPCTVSSSSSSQITCTISGSLVAGTWLPQVVSDQGLLSVAGSVGTQTVTLGVSSISPSSGLNPRGGNMLTILGSNFPNGLADGSSVTIAFLDGTACTLVSSTSTQMQCITSSFSTTGTLSLSITINSMTDSTQSVNVATTTATVTSISPNSYSPVLTTTLVITLSSSYTGLWSRSDFSVNLVPQSSSLTTQPLNVMNADSATNTLTVKFNGATSGIYNVKVSSASYGALDSTGITFQTVGTITSISPSTGSVFGGTKVTITGHTFSTDITDNPVQFGTYDVDVLSSTATSVTVRTPLRPFTTASTDDVHVYLKTYEEATCSTSACQFTWSSATPSLASYAAAFDSATNTYQVTFTGSGFDGTTSTIEVYVDEHQLPIVSASATSVVATINNMDDVSSTDFEFYLASGTPSGYAQLSSGLSLTPKLVSISPSLGSPAGSVIIANIQGVGVNTTSLNLVAGTTTLCSSVKVLSYGKVQCTTTATAITAGTAISVKLGSTTYQCANSDTTQCQYGTVSTMPSVSNAEFSSDSTQLIFQGTNFFTASNYKVTAYYQGVASSTYLLVSATQVTATFPKGIPVSSSPIAPQLLFTDTTTGIGHYAAVTPTIANGYSISSSSNSALTCSFAGGCNLAVAVNGLATSMSNGLASISVCGSPCVYNDALSTSTSASCTIPSLSTSYSISNYNITMPGMLMGTVFATNANRINALTDMDNTFGYTDSTSACSFGMNFDTNFVGVVSQVKFFMSTFVKTTYSGKLAFQYSSDGISYTTQFTVGNEIHEGWNYYDLSTPLKFRYYRFKGSGVGSCNVGEFVMIGQVAINNNANTYQCTPSLTVGTITTPLSNPVTYSASSTPLLTNITPRFGTVKGGTSVTFTGSNLPTSTGSVTITIDNIACTVTAATSTAVTCTTGPRPGLFPDTSLQIYVTGQGNVATQGLLFRYANSYSDEDTWGGAFPPTKGDTIHVPSGMHLLMDADSTPVLNLVLVEGSLIFPPDANPAHVRTFDATYVMVQGGYLEAGTEQFPYTSKLIMTMHGDKYTPEMPTYGSKCIALRDGTIEFHGVPRIPTWTNLSTTAQPGDITITLNHPVDWKAGEEIVIAPTGYNNYEAEARLIMSVDNSNPNYPVLTLNDSLLYKHYSGIETYGTDTLEMRAEVGLLTRNIVFRGDPETSNKNMFGAHLMLHSHGDDSLTAKIEYVEFTDIGQAFQIGRYPIHFHQIGAVMNSYIRGNTFHRSYNRALTIHAVQYLRVIHNVAYDVMGHTFFVEDAIETKNFLDGNLAILTKRSWSILNTDQTPASFWITNPDNIIRNNHAVGADRYGFWFDLQPTSTGPSYSPNVCPINTQLGEFDNNVAHSHGRYGLRIFHGHVPRTYPCSPIVYDSTNPTNPYHANPIITAEFTNFLGYSNNDNGAIAEKVGDVRFINFKVADNKMAGIEFSIAGEVTDGMTQINNALVVGHSANAYPGVGAAYGIVTPRTENFTVTNVRFYNFDQAGEAALGSCSHCFHPASTDSGARTVTFSKLSFTNVPQRILYQFPRKAIYYDLDGTLTGIGAKTWTTPYYKFNDQPECTRNDAVYDGLVCDNTIQVRRIAFDGYAPTTFYGQEIRILKYDDSITSPMDNVTLAAYVTDFTNYGSIIYKKDSLAGWAVPFVTNHKYKISWGFGLDFTQMKVTLSNRWKSSDSGIYMIFNHTDVRAAVDIIGGDGSKVLNQTLINKTMSTWMTGDNVVYNETATRMIHVYVNGKNATRNPLTMNGYRCIGSCMAAINTVAINATAIYWSNPLSWDSGVLPKEGENVEIKSGINMILDLAVTPKLNILEINGRLTVLQTAAAVHLQANYIFVRSGEFLIGNETHPYTGNATITLYGLKQNQYIVFTGMIEAGDKILMNTALMAFYGKQRKNYLSRLTQTANVGDTSISVSAGLDWTAGDKIGLAPTSNNFTDSDYAIITSYDSTTGLVQLDRPLSNSHYGATRSTAATYSGVDIRGEVLLLSRNIVIHGDDVENWGGQILTSDFVEDDGAYRAGNTILSNVEVYNCSQYDTYKSAIRFEGASALWSSVQNSAVHHGNGWGIHAVQSSNILIQDTFVFDFVNFGVQLSTLTNVTVDGAIVMNVHPRNFTAWHMLDKKAGMAICGFLKNDACSEVSVVNTIVAGTDFYGFATPGHVCGDTSDRSFYNNTAHSIRGQGVAVFPSTAAQSTCMEGSNFNVYKAIEAGVFTFYSTKQAIFKNIVVLDSGFGTTLQLGMEGDNLQISVTDSYIYGEVESHDCPYSGYCKDHPEDETCVMKTGVQIPYFNVAGKDLFPTSSSAIPLSSLMGWAAFGGASLFKNVVFSNYKNATTYCGMTQQVIAANPDGADYHPTMTISNSQFINVDQNAFAFIFSPPIRWAVIDDCGLFPCTGPKNILVKFSNVRFTGQTTPATVSSNFQIAGNNPSALSAVSGCSFVSAWNAYTCTNPNLGVLLFESLDDDKTKRTVSPIVIRNNATGFNNTLNTMMDHVWDGFYTGQIRLSRFPAVVEANNDYEILYTGTPPANQRFTLKSENGGSIIQIKYLKAGCYQLYDNNDNLIAANAYSDTLGSQTAITKKSCGENRYLGISNILQFYITHGCVLKVKSIDAILGQIRMNWTLDAFFAAGGTTKFVDRLSSSLGIQPAQIKVVSVYQGSVVVRFWIKSLTDDSNEVARIKASLTSQIASATLNVGAPILNAEYQGETITPIVIGANYTSNSSNSTSSSSSSTKSSSSSAVTVTVSNSTLVVTSSNNGDSSSTTTSTSTSTNSTGGLLDSTSLDTTKIVIIAIVLAAALLFLVIVTVYLYKRQKLLKLQQQYLERPTQDINSPDPKDSGSEKEKKKKLKVQNADILVSNKDLGIESNLDHSSMNPDRSRGILADASSNMILSDNKHETSNFQTYQSHLPLQDTNIFEKTQTRENSNLNSIISSRNKVQPESPTKLNTLAFNMGENSNRGFVDVQNDRISKLAQKQYELTLKRKELATPKMYPPGIKDNMETL